VQDGVAETVLSIWISTLVQKQVVDGLVGRTGVSLIFMANVPNTIVYTKRCNLIMKQNN